jgi:hypothetical protein
MKRSTPDYFTIDTLAWSHPRQIKKNKWPMSLASEELVLSTAFSYSGMMTRWPGSHFSDGTCRDFTFLVSASRQQVPTGTHQFDQVSS